MRTNKQKTVQPDTAAKLVDGNMEFHLPGFHFQRDGFALIREQETDLVIPTSFFWERKIVQAPFGGDDHLGEDVLAQKAQIQTQFVAQELFINIFVRPIFAIEEHGYE